MGAKTPSSTANGVINGTQYVVHPFRDPCAENTSGVLNMLTGSIDLLRLLIGQMPVKQWKH